MAFPAPKFGAAIPVAGSDGTNAYTLLTDTSGRLVITSVSGAPVIVGGPAADDAAASGNPVPVGGIYNTTQPTYTNLDRTQLQMSARGEVLVHLSSGANANTMSVAGADAKTNTQNNYIFENRPYGFNGTTWDRSRSAIGAAAVGTGIGSLSVEEGGRTFNNIKLAAPTTTVVKSGAGHLHSVVINTPVASGVITMYDNTSAAGTEIGIITQPGTILSSGPETVIYDIAFATGLTVVTSGAAQNITVSYR